MPIHWLGFGAFLVAAVILALTPGPGILYVMARTLAGGREDGLASALGTAVGGLVHVMVAAAGLSALLASSAEAFLVVKDAGAAYLVLLGLRTLAGARKQAALESLPRYGGGRAFAEGVLTEALNVKTALFFLAFIPQFVSHQAAAVPQFVLLGVVCVSLNTTVDLVVVFAAARLLPYLRHSPAPARAMSYGSGALLVGLGSFIALTGSRR